jgi:hypothetical protein
MILDSEDQRSLILKALTTVTIQADYPGLCEIFPKMQATVEAVKSATIAEVSDGGK